MIQASEELLRCPACGEIPVCQCDSDEAWEQWMREQELRTLNENRARTSVFIPRGEPMTQQSEIEEIANLADYWDRLQVRADTYAGIPAANALISELAKALAKSRADYKVMARSDGEVKRLSVVLVCGDPALYVDGKRVCKVGAATDEGRLLMSLKGLVR